MYMIFKKLLVIVVLIFFQSNLSAEIPHFLDFRFVLNESTAGKKAQTELKNKLEKGIKNIREKEKNYKSKKKQLLVKKSFKAWGIQEKSKWIKIKSFKSPKREKRPYRSNFGF